MADTNPHTYHGDSSSHYPLANDLTEQQRLHVQHNATLTLMHYNPIHAPLTNPKTIIDIGCGVNADMTLWLARQYPDAKVYGVDLSSVDVEGKDVPRTVEFIKGNILHLVESDERLRPGTIDFVYSRYLIAGIRDWPGYVQTISQLVSPGGYIEIFDAPAIVFRDGELERISDGWEWLRYLQRPVTFPADDPIGDKSFRDLLIANGFADVRSRLWNLPLGPVDYMRKNRPEAVEWAEYVASGRFVAGFKPVFEKLLAGKEKREERERLLGDVERDLKQEVGKCTMLVGCWGRR